MRTGSGAFSNIVCLDGGGAPIKLPELLAPFVEVRL